MTHIARPAAAARPAAVGQVAGTSFCCVLAAGGGPAQARAGRTRAPGGQPGRGRARIRGFCGRIFQPINPKCVQEEDLRRRAQAMRAHLEGSLGAGAREFEDIVEVLVAAGALDPDTLTPRPLGEAARQLNGENELWLATVMTDPAVQVSGKGQSAGPPTTAWHVVKCNDWL